MATKEGLALVARATLRTLATLAQAAEGHTYVFGTQYTVMGHHLSQQPAAESLAHGAAVAAIIEPLGHAWERAAGRAGPEVFFEFSNDRMGSAHLDSTGPAYLRERALIAFSRCPYSFIQLLALVAEPAGAVLHDSEKSLRSAIRVLADSNAIARACAPSEAPKTSRKTLSL